jgi:hypothetical protein
LMPARLGMRPDRRSSAYLRGERMRRALYALLEASSDSG